MSKKTVLILFILLLLLFIPLSLLLTQNHYTDVPGKSAPVYIATPTPFIFTSYTPVSVEKKEVYKIAMIGDSMTAALGPHGGELSEYLNSLYKKDGDTNQRIIIDNYAISSNILAVDSQLNKKFTVSEYTFGPLIKENYDVILLESFAYNPLSQFGVEEGIQRQNKALGNILTQIIQKSPNSSIIFVATIAPNKMSYGQATQPGSTTLDREKGADERIEYLKNHIDYANEHTIPLINIYEKSLTSTGDGNKKYINPNDNIHPSFEGITFIKNEIGDYIFSNKIIPL